MYAKILITISFFTCYKLVFLLSAMDDVPLVTNFIPVSDLNSNGDSLRTAFLRNLMLYKLQMFKQPQIQIYTYFLIYSHICVFLNNKSTPCL